MVRDGLRERRIHGRHCIPEEGGLVYDLGASTGNMRKLLGETLDARGCRYFGIDKAGSMVGSWQGDSEELIVGDVTEVEYRPFDVAILHLCLTFVPVRKRMPLLTLLRSRMKPGGAIIITDRVGTTGYLGLILERMRMRMKLNCEDPQANLEKEFSLAGVQRPVEPGDLGEDAREWFQMGSFAAWLIEG